MIGRFLCRIGIHRWHHVDFIAVIVTETVRCGRCGQQAYRTLG
jgi:hypothetical protein